MLKVVHLTSAHRRYDQRILWRECCSLREHGYDVTLVVNDDQGNETLENGINILSTGLIPSGRWQRMTEGVNRVFEMGLAQDADIYHLHDAELLTIALKLKQHGKKVFFDSHEVYGDVIKGRPWIPSWMRKGLSFAYNVYETYVCKRIDGVIDAGVYDGKERFLHRTKRFAHVQNYPKKTEFQGNEIPPFGRRKNVCYSGGVSRERGISILAEACKIVGEKLVLAGKFSSNQYEKEILEKYPNTVSYLGFITERGKIFKMYADCAVGACILLDVGQYGKSGPLPTKVYEYMSMAMPIIISDFPHNRALIEKYHFGLVADPNDIEDVASKIKWLIDHSKEAEKMGINGKRFLEENFTWDVAERNLLELYNEV